MLHRYFLLLLALLTLGGCSLTSRLQVPGGYCDPPLPYRYDPAFAPQPDFEAALTPALLARYPRRNLLTANAAGLLPALRQLLAYEEAYRQKPGPATEVPVLRQRQLILGQLALVGTTVGSIAAELDCEGERASQVAVYLQQYDQRQTQRLNSLSISIGALSGIATTLFNNRALQITLGSVGGTAAAALGLLTLRPKHEHKLDFQHPRNLLTDVWNETPDPAVWPPSLWYMLSTPAFSNAGQTSIIHNTRQRWMRYDQLAHPDSKQGKPLVALLFGPGGKYGASELSLRANLLNQMQSAVRLLDQELQGLLLVMNEQAK